MARIHTNEDGTMVVRDDWYASDIQEVAVDVFDKMLSNKQLQKVMHYLVNTHDANIGINWEVIEIAIDEVLNGEMK